MRVGDLDTYLDLQTEIMATCHQFGESRSHVMSLPYLMLERKIFRRAQLTSAVRNVAELAPKHVKTKRLLEEIHFGVYIRTTCYSSIDVTRNV